MWYAHHGPWCFGFVFLFLLLAFIIFRVTAFRRYGGWHRGWPDDAEAILRKRLANGEINEEKYQKLKDVLKK